MESWNERINREIAQFQGKVSMLIKRLDAVVPLYEYHSEERLISASMIKVAILLAILEEVRAQRAHLSDSLFVSETDILKDTKVFVDGGAAYCLEELLAWMIIESDNTATNVLIQHFSMELINAYIKNHLQVSNTCLKRRMMDQEAVKQGFDNYTSEQDMCVIFTKLFAHELLTPQLCDLAIAMLYNQRCQNQLMRYIYQPVPFAHKTGTLSNLNHDMGVMKIKNTLYYVGVSLYDCQDMSINKKLIGKLGRLIYEQLCAITQD